MIIYLFIELLINIIVPPGNMIPPPGTKKVNDSLFLDENFMNVLEYKVFLAFSKVHTGLLDIDYSKCLPDSNINYYGKPYLNSRNYDEDYPILNLTAYQKVAYCKFRSYVVNVMKNNYDKRCNHAIWDKFDIGDPLRILEIEYAVADSTTINLYKPFKILNVPEIYRNDNTSTMKYMHKHFDRDVVGFRCVARYIPIP